MCRHLFPREPEKEAHGAVTSVANSSWLDSDDLVSSTVNRYCGQGRTRCLYHRAPVCWWLELRPEGLLYALAKRFLGFPAKTAAFGCWDNTLRGGSSQHCCMSHNRTDTAPGAADIVTGHMDSLPPFGHLGDSGLSDLSSSVTSSKTCFLTRPGSSKPWSSIFCGAPPVTVLPACVTKSKMARSGVCHVTGT